MNLSKPRTYVNCYTNYYICIKFGSSIIKNGLRNVKKVEMTNETVMHIFNEVHSQTLYTTPFVPRVISIPKIKKAGKIKIHILEQNVHATHLLKNADGICKYEIDSASIVEDTEQTRFRLQADGQTEGWMNRQTDGQNETSGTPLSTSLAMEIFTMQYIFVNKIFWFEE